MTEFLLWGMAPAALISFVCLLAFAVPNISRAGFSGRTTAIEAGFVLSAVCIIFIACHPTFRVLNDETSFLNIARSLLSTGKSNNFPEWIWQGGKLVPRLDMLSFRPVLFPVLLSVPGVLLGPAAFHGFVLNFFVTCVLFLIVYKWTAISWGRTAGALAISLLAINATLSLSATSSGYDLLSLCFATLTFVAWETYQKSLGYRQLGLLLFSGVCFASTRIEGILAIALIWIMIVPELIKTRNLKKLSLVIFSAVLTFPVLLQRLAYYPHVEIRTLGAFVSLANVAPNALSLISGFFLRPFGPFPVFSHALGLYFILRHWRCFGHRHIRPLAIFLGIYLLFLFCFHDGRSELPYQARLFLPFSMILCIAATRALTFENRKWLKAFFTGAIALQALLSFAVMRSGVIFFEPPIASEFKAVREFVNSRDEKTVYIYLNPGPIAAFGRAAIQPRTFDRNRAWFREMLMNEKLGPVMLIEAWPPQWGARPESLESNETKLLAEVSLENLRTLRFLEVSASAVIRAPAPK